MVKIAGCGQCVVHLKLNSAAPYNQSSPLKQIVFDNWYALQGTHTLGPRFTRRQKRSGERDRSPGSRQCRVLIQIENTCATQPLTVAPVRVLVYVSSGLPFSELSVHPALPAGPPPPAEKNSAGFMANFRSHEAL